MSREMVQGNNDNLFALRTRNGINTATQQPWAFVDISVGEILAQQLHGDLGALLVLRRENDHQQEMSTETYFDTRDNIEPNVWHPLSNQYHQHTLNMTVLPVSCPNKHNSVLGCLSRHNLSKSSDRKPLLCSCYDAASPS